MSSNDLLDVVLKANKDLNGAISEEMLQQVLDVVIKHPLPKERGIAQDQIYEFLKARMKDKGSL